MILYFSDNSPYARKVLVLAKEAGLEQDMTLQRASGSPLDPANLPLAENPLGKIPTLVRDDGPALYDSRVICRFLDDRAGSGFYPAAPRLWDSLTIEATADGIMDAALLMVYESRLRPEPLRMPDWVEGQWRKIDRALDTLEGRWLSHLAGPLDIGQIALGCALGYLDLRHADRVWRSGREGLADWAAGFLGRPAMQATRPQ
ncbi:glutathione S-transferase [Plastorhodobacter daqingensis]|uniref:Glutathione S-transferase n=1 Tax=Plastorhodobacter daqingensis TaxID=1387281 RepID=A0ABW2UFN9_9RHOB